MDNRWGEFLEASHHNTTVDSIRMEEEELPSLSKDILEFHMLIVLRLELIKDCHLKVATK